VLKFRTLLVLAALGAGGWYFFTHYKLQGVENLKVEPRAPGRNEDGSAKPSGEPLKKKTIRIATANLGPLDQAKLARPNVVGRLAQIIRQFDLVAIQDIQARDQAVLVQLVEQVNAQGRHYGYAVPPAVGRDPVQQYSAFVFDGDAVQVDRATVTSVDNRSGHFRHPPLVAAFQSRGPVPQDAFTFTLINVHTPPDRAEAELDLLAAVYRAVRDDGRNEDDVILLGDLGADEEHLGQLGQVANLTPALAGVPTTTRGTRRADNLLFDRRATTEYTRRSGVVDLMREFNVQLREAVEISDHLPAWAEFSVYEGGQQ
jgi:hypothetical protein